MFEGVRITLRTSDPLLVEDRENGKLLGYRWWAPEIVFNDCKVKSIEVTTEDVELADGRPAVLRTETFETFASQWLKEHGHGEGFEPEPWQREMLRRFMFGDGARLDGVRVDEVIEGEATMFYGDDEREAFATPKDYAWFDECWWVIDQASDGREWRRATEAEERWILDQ